MPYRSPTKPMAQQREALRRIEKAPHSPGGHDVFALFMDMGTGKSKVVLDRWGMEATNGGVRDLLMIAPAGSIRNWYEDKSDLQPSEMNRHLDPAFREDVLFEYWGRRGGQDKKNRLRKLIAERDRPRALFVNVESFSTTKDAQDLVREFLESGLVNMTVDESTTIKGYKSQRTKNIIEIGEDAAARVIMSGLPTPKSPIDYFSQFDFLDWKIIGQKSFFTFRNRYAVVKNKPFGKFDPRTGRKRMIPVIEGYQNLDELREKTAPWVYRVLKKDCLDLPPKTYVIRDVEMTDEQRRIYREMTDYGNALVARDPDAFATATMMLQQVMRKHQLLMGYIRDEHGQVHDVPENRTTELLEVLEEHAGKAVIWIPELYPLRKVVARLQKEYGPRAVAQFHGGNMKTRGEDERRFLGDPECLFMCATQGAGGRGNTWVVADLEIYYGNDDNLEHRDQSEDRIHRVGQKSNKVTVVDLAVPDSIDYKIIKSLRNKIDLATAVTGESYREWLI